MFPWAGAVNSYLRRLTSTTDRNGNHSPHVLVLNSPQIKRWKKWLEMYHAHVWNTAQEGLGSGPPHTIQLVLVFRQDLLNTCKPCVSVWILFVQITSSVVKLFLSDPGYRFVLYTHHFFTLGFPPVSVHTQNTKLWRRELSLAARGRRIYSAKHWAKLLVKGRNHPWLCSIRASGADPEQL